MENIKHSIIAIIRGVDPEAGCEITQALLESGIDSIEVSLSDGESGLQTLRNISARYKDTVNLGAGTVTTPAESDAAIAAGATYLITPGWDKELARYIQQKGVAILPGVYTPGEIMQAQAMGITSVKLFPANVAGMAFVKAMQGPFPNMRYVAVGGVDVNNAAQMLKQGFYALGIGSELVPRGSAPGCGGDIAKRAASFVEAVKAAQ